MEGAEGGAAHAAGPGRVVGAVRRGGGGPRGGVFAVSETRLRCEAHHLCPHEGWWFTPAEADSRCYFKFGEIMPDLGSAWGLTIWQWDENQG